MIQFMRKKSRKTLGKEDGNATVEFVLLFPVFLGLLFSAAELGILSLRGMMLERATNVVVRELRLGLALNPDYAYIKDRICEEAPAIQDCSDSLTLELTPVDTLSWSFFDNTSQCIDKTAVVDPALTFTAGNRNELMMMRVCVSYDTVFPLTGLAPYLLKQADGRYAIVARSAFVNEPV